ncbi:MAG: cellulase family glycosylhydrolase [Deltaproteobacteria bacterium]|nr:cellulase family glycosylhydrolase [Deltaproteobacteria bacterium]
MYFIVRGIIVFSWSLFILSGCSPGAKSHPVQYGPFSGTIGISTHLDMCKDPSNTAGMEACTYQLQQLKSAGVVYVRTDFTWSQIEPQQGRFDFTGYDSLVNAILGSGLQIDAILDYGNAWADAKGSNSYPPDDPQTFADFAYQVALHYKGRIHSYEIWNEENTGSFGLGFWPPAPDPEAYGLLLEDASRQIKSADPGARVVFGGVLMKAYGLNYTGDTFIDLVLGLYPDMSNYIDAVAFHPYMNYPPSVAPEFSSTTQLSFDQMCDDVKAALKKHGVSKPLWITEIGWPTYPPVDEGMQARWLVRMYLEAVEQGIESVYWYDFIDGTGCSVPVQECYFGLFDYIASPSFATPPQPKQAFSALKAMATILSGTSFDSDVSSRFKLIGARAMYFTSADGPRDVWVFFAEHGAPPQTVSVPMTGLTFYDISGTTFTPPGTGSAYSLTVTTSPVYAVRL